MKSSSPLSVNEVSVRFKSRESELKGLTFFCKSEAKPNWRAGTLKREGRGKPPAERSALRQSPVAQLVRALH